MIQDEPSLAPESPLSSFPSRDRVHVLCGYLIIVTCIFFFFPVLSLSVVASLKTTMFPIPKLFIENNKLPFFPHVLSIQRLPGSEY